MPKAIDLPLSEVKQWPILLGLPSFEDPPDGITHAQALWFRQLLLATIEENGANDGFVGLSDEWDLRLDIQKFDD
jgi:hypothetical protein